MRITNILILLLSGLLFSCSSEESGTGSGDHVWKEQVDTMDRAKEAEQKMLDAAELQRQVIEEQTK